MTRSKPQNDSLLADNSLPSGPELVAIAELWKRTQRSFVAQFDGVSMRPTIEPQQPLTVHCGKEPTVGDVVLAIRGGHLIVHRIIWQSKQGNWLLTRGDARAVPDPPLDVNDIAGVVDAPQFVPRATQRIALRVVSAAASFGRVAAAIAVRGLQVVAWSRNRAGSKI